MLLENLKKLVNDILSNEVFKDVDKSALFKKYKLSEDKFSIHEFSSSSCAPVTTSSNEISIIPDEGLIINKPGIYTITQDINWTPNTEACSAIRIACDNVILDMNGCCISAQMKDSNKKISGIIIKNGESIRNITILNGKIKDMCISGISASFASNLTIDKLVIEGLSLMESIGGSPSMAGIMVDHSSNINIYNCSITNIIVKAGSSAGIQLLYSNSGIISACSIDSIHNNAGSAQGYSYMYCEGITTLNCKVSNLESKFSSTDVAVGHTVIGFIAIMCKGLIYDTCTSTDFKGCCDDCHGMSIFLVMNVLVSNFYACDITDGIPSGGAKATGLEIYGVSVKVSNSLVRNIKAINPKDKQSAGFSAAGMGINFSDCIAENVTLTDSNGMQSEALGYAVGFGWAPDPRPVLNTLPALNVSYLRCISNDCEVAFDTWNHVNSFWTDIDTGNCLQKILVQPGAKRYLSADKCSECDPPIINQELINFERGNVY